jgi:acyl dehydratase
MIDILLLVLVILGGAIIHPLWLLALIGAAIALVGIQRR